MNFGALKVFEFLWFKFNILVVIISIKYCAQKVNLRRPSVGFKGISKLLGFICTRNCIHDQNEI